MIVVFFGGDWTMTPEGPGFNKIAGASLQAVGALLVLISLDGNLGLFAGKSIIAGAGNGRVTIRRNLAGLPWKFLHQPK